MATSEHRQFRHVVRGLRASDSAWARRNDRRYRLAHRVRLAVMDLVGGGVLLIGAVAGQPLVIFAGVLSVVAGLTAHLS